MISMTGLHDVPE